MSLILNIDTAVEGASVCLADNEKVGAFKINPSQKDSAAWLHIGIEKLLKESAVNPGELAAIAVSAGPGSYTGLRVGMSAAKGLCFALNIPLIFVGTLKMMATAAKKHTSHLLCPMIDARRMEVFTAVFDNDTGEVMPASNMILSVESFSGLLEKNIITFFGNGSEKFKKITENQNARFLHISASAKDMANLSFEKLVNKEFSNLAYSEPFYGKEFYAPPKKIL